MVRGVVPENVRHCRLLREGDIISKFGQERPLNKSAAGLDESAINFSTCILPPFAGMGQYQVFGTGE